MTTDVQTSASSPALSSEEISRAAQYLLSTQDEVTQAVQGLSPAQYRFKPAPEEWSIAEILEHLVLVEKRVHGRIRGLEEGAPAERGRDNAAIDASIFRDVPQRAQKVPAPPVAVPSGQGEPAEWLARFREARAETLALLKTAPWLRGRVAPHPVAGTWDGYQWILGVGAHSARHFHQIKEVMAHAGFPCDKPHGGA